MSDRRSWARRASDFLLGFFREHTRSSSARLVAIMTATVGSLLGVGAAAIVFVIAWQLWHHTLDMKLLGPLAEVLKDLSWPIGAFIGSGAVAILARSRTGVTSPMGGLPHPAPPDNRG